MCRIGEVRVSAIMGVRVRLHPSPAQENLLTRHAGAARFAYNWGLEVRQAVYAHTGGRENAKTLHRLLNSLKPTTFPWMYEVSKCAPQEALRDLDRAYENWWRRLREGKRGRQAGAPRFRSRQRDGVGGFRLTGSIRVEQNDKRAWITLPRIGRIRLSETHRLPVGALAQVTVRERAGRWYVSAQVPAAVKARYGRRERQVEPEGVDLGLSAFVTLTDGSRVKAERRYRAAMRKLRRLERENSRRRPGSANRAKTRATIARQHERITNQRTDLIHKLTTHLATTRSRIVIEDLNVQGMVKNHILALSVLDAGFGEFRRQLTYKANWYGTRLEIAPRYYPSTQTCSGCGNVKTGDARLGLSDRTYSCDHCGLTLDRDHNAARNLAGLHGTEHTMKVTAASCAEVSNAYVSRKPCPTTNRTRVPSRDDLGSVRAVTQPTAA
jgi:putative transposase